MPDGKVLIKIVVRSFGSGDSGSSSLLMRLTNDIFGINQHHTIGVEFFKKEKSINGNTIANYQFWDFAGQESYNSLFSLYVRESMGAVICIKPDDLDRTDNQGFEKFISLIQQSTRKRVEDIPIFLVITKYDTASSNKEEVDAKIAELKEKYPNYPLFITSAKTGLGVTEAFEGIMNITWETYLQNYPKKPENNKQPEQNTEGIKSFFAKTIRSTPNPMTEKNIGILAISSSGGGTTTLLKRVRDDVFDPCVGVSIGAEFFIKTKNIKDNNTPAKYQFWDFPGQERYLSIFAAYIPGSMGIAICIEPNDFSPNKQGWLENLILLIGRSKGNRVDNIPMFLIITKHDTIGPDKKEKFDKKIAGLKNKYPNYPLFITSAKTGLGVTEAFEEIMKITLETYLKSHPSKPKDTKSFFDKWFTPDQVPSDTKIGPSPIQLQITPTPIANNNNMSPIPTNTVATPPIISASTITSLSTAANQVQEFALTKEDFPKKLRQQIEDDAERLPYQTIKDYQTQLQYFKKEIQKQLQENINQRRQQQQEIQQLKSQLGQTTGKIHTSLEARISDLEKKQNLLMQDYDAQQTHLAQKEHIFKQQALARFYRTIQNKLQQVFLAYKVIASGIVVHHALTTTDKVIKTIALAGEAVPLPGSQAIATWLGYMINAGVWLAEKQSKKSNDEKINDIAEIAVSFQELDTLTETTARRLTFMYEEQLQRVTPDGAGILAEAAVKLMIAYLWAEEYRNEEPVEQLVASVACIYQEHTAQKFWQSLKENFKDLKDKFKDNKITTIQPEENWSAFTIFQRPGIEVPITPNSIYYSGGGTQPHVYGYRLGTLAEVKAAGLEQTPARVGAAKKLPPSSQQYLNHLTQQTNAVKNQGEINTIQLRQTKAKQDEFEERLTKVEQKQASSSSSAVMVNQFPNTFKLPIKSTSIDSTIFIEGCKLTINMAKIEKNRHAEVNTLMETYANNCAKTTDITRNCNNHITILIFPSMHHVESLKEELLKILGISLNMQAKFQ